MKPSVDHLFQNLKLIVDLLEALCLCPV